jgi:hypothetical protein
MNKKIQLSILSIFIAAALVGSVATYGDNIAFAGGDKHKGDKDKGDKDKGDKHKGDQYNGDKDKGDQYNGDKHKGDQYNGDKNKINSNNSTQGIDQSTETLQASSCGSGNDTTASCNNVALSFNLNDGNNALGQQ